MSGRTTKSPTDEQHKSDSAAAASPRWRRRELLAALAGGVMLTGLGATFAGMPGPGAARTSEERRLSAQGDSDDSYALGWVDADGQLAGEVATGFRGHAVLQHPSRRDSALVLSRRPGTRALEIDLDAGRVVGKFRTDPGRHLFGHGCFSADGRVLFTTEADVARGRGLVVVRDASDYSVLDEWPSHGIGPHDIRLLPDGRTLVVANGGILTRPDTGRTPLNLDSMASSLAYLDAQSGHPQDVFTVQEPKSSIRHLDVAPDGTVAFAIQLQRQAAGHDRTVPLAGVQRPGEGLTLFEQPGQVVDRLQDYVGSVAICGDNRVAGFASPRGNLVAFWSVDDGRLLGYHRLRDVCGIDVSARHNAFVLSNSFGEICELDATTFKERRDRRISMPGRRWDNHLLVVQGV